MSRFDDELRGAAGQLADQEMPAGLLDEALDPAPSGPRWPALAAVVVAGLLVAVVAGIGVGELLPSPSPTPEPSPITRPTSTEVAEATSTPAPTSTTEPTPDASPAPAPTAAPAVPVTASVVEDQIRLTITLDRDQTVHGQRVWAELSVENIGPDTVHWGHSGTCDWVAGATVEPAFEPPPEPYGREDWTGDEEILKRHSVDVRASRTQGFTPEQWVGFEGVFGCTSDFVPDTIGSGERLTHRAAWDTMGAHGAPPPPGPYRVTATFAYLNRGAEPVDHTGDLATIEASVVILVDGLPIGGVSPGLAVDAILEDGAFQDLLADAPRERWLGTEFVYEDGIWLLALHLEDPVEALVARVDAATGEVLSVGLEQRRRPGAG